MSTIFPGSASVGQVYNNYTFDGTAWNINGIDLTENYLEESSASATYLTQVSASTNYAAKAGATFTGNITAPEVHATTKLVAETVGGDEGGEILLEKAATNTTLSGTGVTIDVWQNRLRFFEQGGDARGGYIDVSTLSNGVGTNLVPGINLIKKQNIGSGVTSVTVTDAFSSAYDVYKIIVNGGVGSTTSNFYLQLSGITSGYFANLNYRTFANTGNSVANSGSQSYWFWVGGQSTSGQQMSIELSNPFTNKPKFIVGTHYNLNAGDVGSGIGYNNSTASATGFTISAESGTITGGTIYVYGYSKG